MAHKQHTHSNPASRAQRIAEMKEIRKKWRAGSFKHFLRVFFTLIFAVVFALLMLSYQFFIGPSRAGSDLLIHTLMESSAMKFYPYLFLRDEQVQQALDRNGVIPSEEATNVSLITVKARNAVSSTGDSTIGAEPEKDIEIIEIKGATYRGYMMIVLDPSRVSVGVCNYPFSDDTPGKRVNEIVDAYGGIAGLNGGAFVDAGGSGNGGQPAGLVYSNGQRLKRSTNDYPVVAAFDKNDILHVGKITTEMAEELGIRDAVAFGPALIVNGEPSVVSGQGSGLNPRSAIGQRADGAVLLLAIDGRHANSLGASYEDLIEIMVEYGAVNACNLDGGSSVALFYEGKQINDGLAVSGSRKLPTAWVVK